MKVADALDDILRALPVERTEPPTWRGVPINVYTGANDRERMHLRTALKVGNPDIVPTAIAVVAESFEIKG